MLWPSAVRSGVLTGPPVTCVKKTEETGGRATEELLLLAIRPATEVNATVTFEMGEGRPRVSFSATNVRREASGIDAEALQEAAKGGCHVSQALQGNPALSVEATLVLDGPAPRRRPGRFACGLRKRMVS